MSFPLRPSSLPSELCSTSSLPRAKLQDLEAVDAPWIVVVKLGAFFHIIVAASPVSMPLGGKSPRTAPSRHSASSAGSSSVGRRCPWPPLPPHQTRSPPLLALPRSAPLALACMGSRPRRRSYELCQSSIIGDASQRSGDVPHEEPIVGHHK